MNRAIGSWDQGAAVCQAEFGAAGYAFSIPVNGYMNRHLRQALASARSDAMWGAGSDDAWLSRRD